MKKKKFLLLLLFFIYQTVMAHVKILNPVGGETFNVGEQINIEWDPYIDHGPATFTIEYSTDTGSTWITIQSDINKSERSYSLTIPDIQTTLARVKVIQVNLEYDHISDQSENFTITSVTSGVDEPLNKNNFELNYAYPNPFNNSTFISYQLKERSFTQLIVYDIQGREITRIVSQIKSAGKHEVGWNATGLASGTYIIVLKAGNNLATRKLLLLK